MPKGKFGAGAVNALKDSLGNRLKHGLGFGLLLGLMACGPGHGSPSGEQSIVAIPEISVDGSSTVFPITEAMGEEFQLATRIRVSVGQSGTGGGLKKFCRGEIDVAAASRPIKGSEIEECTAANVSFIELPIALDALAMVVPLSNSWAQCLSVEELARAWGPQAEGRKTAWTQIRVGFPPLPLTLYGPGVDSGTFDYFTLVVNGKEGVSRTDFTATEDDNVILQGVGADRGALGYLGLAYAEEGKEHVRVVSIRQPDGSCVTPSVDHAREGTYKPFTRPLFYYANAASVAAKPHVRQFLAYVFDPANAALVKEVGYVPMPASAYARVKARLDARTLGHAGGDLEALIRGEAPPRSPQ